MIHQFHHDKLLHNARNIPKNPKQKIIHCPLLYYELNHKSTLSLIQKRDAYFGNSFINFG